MSRAPDKKELRCAIKAKIKTLTQEYCEVASDTICKKIEALDEYKKAKCIFIFIGTMKGEPDTRSLIEKALDEGKTVCVPLCIDDGIMIAKKIENLTSDLEKGYFGLLEPLHSLETVAVDEIDLALVPCVTCDYSGNRLGHGKGFYDRFLEDKNFEQVLVCFDKLISDKIPTEPFDKAINKVITEA